MYGVIASMRPHATGGGVSFGDTQIDFIAGAYMVDGATVTAADIIDKPSRIGASGLEILDDDIDGVVAVQGDLLTLLLYLDWTLVIEYEELKSTYITRPISMTDGVGGAFFYISRNAPGGGLTISANDSSTKSREAMDESSHGPGIYRIAVTRTQTQLAISVNGSTVQMDTTNHPMSIATAGFGGDVGDYSFNGCYIRSLALYPAVSSSELPSLSSLPTP